MEREGEEEEKGEGRERGRGGRKERKGHGKGEGDRERGERGRQRHNVKKVTFVGQDSTAQHNKSTGQSRLRCKIHRLPQLKALSPEVNPPGLTSSTTPPNTGGSHHPQTSPNNQWCPRRQNRKQHSCITQLQDQLIL